MEGPWKHNPWYSFFRPYVDFCVRFCFRSARVEGLENIPSDGAVIIAPNHCNTLMDALVVLRSRRSSTVFGARADIFENRTAAAILRFLRILPMVRRRDGIRKVLRNYETIDQVTDVLRNGVPFCMFAEGAHSTKHSLLPINKGIFRIAKAAHETLSGSAASGAGASGASCGNTKDVYLVPAGIEYGDYFRFFSWSRLRYGKAINVSEIIRQNPELSEAELFALLRERLVKGIASRIVYFPNDDNYPASWEQFQSRFARLYGSSPRNAGLPKSRFFKGLLTVLLAPFFVLSSVLSLPMWGIAEWLCANKVKDKAFHNTVRFALKLLGNIIFGLVWGILFFSILPWYLALALLAYFFASYSIFYYYLNIILPTP